MQPPSKTSQRRKQVFERLLISHRKNNRDQTIPGYRKDNRDSQSYLLHIRKLDDLSLPRNMKIDDGTELYAQFHMSLFYRNMKDDKQFFFGRTVKSSRIQLKQHKSSR